MGVTSQEKLFVYPGVKNYDCWHEKYQQVTNGQVEKVVVKYLKENPEQLHSFVDSSIISALTKAFPLPEECETKK